MGQVWEKFKKNTNVHRLATLCLIILVLYTVCPTMNTISLTFIFTYLIVHSIRFTQKRLSNLPSQVIVVLAYLLVIATIYFAITIYVPTLIKQIVKMSHSLMKFYQSDNMDWLIQYLSHYISDSEITTQTKHGVTILVRVLTNVGTLTTAFSMLLIMSFLYTIELDSMNELSYTFLNSRHLPWLSRGIAYFGNKFVNTFGVVLEVQFFIALRNTAMTMICPITMKMPQIIALGLMAFILGLISAAGVIISLILSSFVAYSVSGTRHVIYIFIVITIIHAIEVHILNPKFMPSKTELPIFYILVVSLAGEHFLGTWGLIVGVPIFTFPLDILGVESVKTKKSKISKIESKK